METRWEEMVRREFQNIKELEEDERKQAEAVSQAAIDSLLLDVDSERLVIPQDLDTWFNDFSSGTAAEASGSS